MDRGGSIRPDAAGTMQVSLRFIEGQLRGGYAFTEARATGIHVGVGSSFSLRGYSQG
jgi:hypothetical protein